MMVPRPGYREPGEAANPLTGSVDQQKRERIMDLAQSGGISVSRPAAPSPRPRRSGLALITALFLSFGAGSGKAEVWNLPYARPAAYDFSSLYSPSLKAYLAINPD